MLDDIKLNKLKSMLSDSRFTHTIGVADTAVALAMHYEPSLVDDAKVAGYLHDCAKCLSHAELYNECNKYNIELTDDEKEVPELVHSILGVEYAKEYFDITDEVILNAIKWHTTGRPNMSMLEKIIFVADYIEPGRDKAPNLSFIRPLAFKNIDLAIYHIAKDTIDYLSQKQYKIDNRTIETLNYYKECAKYES